MHRLEPVDVIAFILVVGCLTLFAFHNESEAVKLVLISVVSYYFGKKSSNGSETTHRHTPKIEIP